LDWFNFPCNFQGNIKKLVAIIWDVRVSQLLYAKELVFGEMILERSKVIKEFLALYFPFNWKKFRVKYYQQS
jgi:hypothetical protein